MSSPSIWISKRINWIISEVQVSGFFFDFFNIEQSTSSPGKWNWNQVGFLSFIFIFGQCALLQKCVVEVLQNLFKKKPMRLGNHVMPIFYPDKTHTSIQNWQVQVFLLCHVLAHILASSIQFVLI